MNRNEMKSLLGRVRSGKVKVADAVDRIQAGRDPVRRLESAQVDLERAARRGFPEAIYAPGKTAPQIIEIAEALSAAGQTVLITRIEPELAKTVTGAFAKARHHAQARAVVLQQGSRRKGRRGVVVITAGTSDEPIAEEAALTAELMGNHVERIRDVGAAGIHRLLEHEEALRMAKVLVVVAGMDGVLPTVVAGLTAVPVIGVPTSTGYGIGSGGEAALLTMLNACSPGVTVVNIDNGFGAGYAASMINLPARSTKIRKSKKPGQG